MNERMWLRGVPLTLDHDVTVTGDVMADLFASTSGTDGDWVVKLIDAYPDDGITGQFGGIRIDDCG